jgi:hypothetical protein
MNPLDEVADEPKTANAIELAKFAWLLRATVLSRSIAGATVVAIPGEMLVVVRGETLVVMRGEMVISEPPPPIASAWQSVRVSMMKKIKGRHQAARLKQRSGALTKKNQANVALGVAS